MNCESSLATPEIEVGSELSFESLKSWILCGSLGPLGKGFVREWPPTPSPSRATATTAGLFQTDAERAHQTPDKLGHLCRYLSIGNCGRNTHTRLIHITHTIDTHTHTINTLLYVCNMYINTHTHLKCSQSHNRFACVRHTLTPIALENSEVYTKLEVCVLAHHQLCWQRLLTDTIPNLHSAVSAALHTSSP